MCSIPEHEQHTFRACTDDAFVSSKFLSSICSGEFTTRLAQHNISFVLGEVCDEGWLYAFVNPPVDLAGISRQLGN